MNSKDRDNLLDLVCYVGIVVSTVFVVAAIFGGCSQ
jgi:hypothetical protein